MNHPPSNMESRLPEGEPSGSMILRLTPQAGWMLSTVKTTVFRRGLIKSFGDYE